MPPLTGIKVLDFTQAAGGPYGAMLLGDMGAEVIKVEPPTGDHFRPMMGGAWAVALNRNKRSLAIDLKKEQSREIIRRLIMGADVLLEAFVPGVMDRFGLGYEQVKELNPQLIYCSMSGYGQTGPYCHRAGYDVCAQAESGLMAATGEEGRPPIRIGASLVDYGTGMFAAFGIAMALLDKEKSHAGQHIDVSLLETAMSWMNYWITHYSMTGEDPPRVGSGHLFSAPYQVFDTSDGQMFVGVQNDRFWHKFCNTLGLNQLENDPRFATNEVRKQHRSELVMLLSDVLRGYSTAELGTALAEAGIPYAPVLPVSQAVSDPHVQARNIVQEQYYPDYGTLKFPGVPVRLSRTPGELRRHAPRLGEHTVEILAESGYTREEIAEFLKARLLFQDAGTGVPNT